jgi:hypothetical protein
VGGDSNGRAGRELAWIGFGVVNKLLQGLGGHIRVDDQRVAIDCDESDCGKVLDRIEVEVAVKRFGHGIWIGTAELQRVTIRAGKGYGFCAGASAGTRLVLDDDDLPEF